ncbi:MAG TPA: D-aminoacylase [Thermoanaerobaculia bacterium]|nr:D-aminoacylase [Thermoanaerobaculia bacterium]
MPSLDAGTVRWLLAAGVLAGIAASTGCGQPPSEPVASGLLIRDARVVDGTGAPERLASVRVAGDRIAAIGALAPLPGETVVEADGLVLAPGFVDTHSHYDDGLLAAPQALAAVSQGITTVVVGQDGLSHHPLADWFAALEAAPPAVNVASYSGHGTLRERVLGGDYRRHATEAEVTAMRALLRADLDAGALGLATGLEYDPGLQSSTEEVVALAREAAVAGGRYISHLRSEDRFFWEAVDEIVRIGREAAVPVQISHLKLAMRSLWGEADRLLARLEEVRAAGVEVTADVYPYEYWQSSMTVLFPERDFTDLEEARFVLRELAAPENVLLGRFEPDPALVGRTLAAIAAERGTEPARALLDLIAESGAGERAESIIATSMATEDVARLLEWEHANVCTDGELDGRHPRGFGAFPRVLAWLVREEGRLGLEEAIRRMTSLAADHVGLAGRGRLVAGAPADLVLLDPATVVDRATPEDPQRPAEGIRTVWVAGRKVYDGGAPTGERPGRVLRRGATP